MERTHEKVKKILEKYNVNAKHLVLNQTCHSVKEAAEVTNAQVTDFVKNICMMDSNDNLIVAIVKGEHRDSTSRVGKGLDINRPRLADEEEVFEQTGFPPGGVPSFGFKGKFLIDLKVMEMDFIYTVGGSEKSLVKINTQDLVKLNQGEIIRVRK
ncbi:aminoacyl-tRNA deacylase [Staphylococcus caeli]|uniref:Prolyl-tRNA synthetase n=1 Tax=Staphylococcus caeli TaxID=2201815 RepID=A0A1D4IQZ4_9STAP|nr:YbaK/EbsC family protein [Staphylococcus caeli]SCS51761.1 prolyl-tRNA synthetase [Staphylococcus caeli]SCS91338.1 prolyl-tRNA synthetase [Staphylococcus caeli]